MVINLPKTRTGATTATAGLYRGFGAFSYAGGEIFVAGALPTYTSIFKTQVEDFILLENGSFMLQETGDKIILEQSLLHPVPPTNVSQNTALRTNVPKS
jgi:hypothetical protein